ncbi:MAG: response regulator transcription factor [Planctomycetota bacterium]
MRVLVVDGDTSNRDELCQRMRPYAITVDTANDGQQAVRCVEDAARCGHAYDLVTVAVHLPDGDGRIVVQHLRQMETGAGAQNMPLRIIAVDTDSPIDTIIDCLECGCDCYVTIPFAEEELLRHLRHMRLWEAEAEA